MDIKLRARLSAYSKIESISGLNSGVPVPEATDTGAVLGVSDTGKYTLFPTVKETEIDSLFSDAPTEETVSKEEIDSLFEGDKAVPEAVSKEEIDTLFENKKEESNISTVSFADIDSLFG